MFFHVYTVSLFFQWYNLAATLPLHVSAVYGLNPWKSFECVVNRLVFGKCSCDNGLLRKKTIQMICKQSLTHVFSKGGYFINNSRGICFLGSACMPSWVQSVLESTTDEFHVEPSRVPVVPKRQRPVVKMGIEQTSTKW